MPATVTAPVRVGELPKLLLGRQIGPVFKIDAGRRFIQQVGTDKDIYLSREGQMIPFSAVEVSGNG